MKPKEQLLLLKAIGDGTDDFETMVDNWKKLKDVDSKKIDWIPGEKQCIEAEATANKEREDTKDKA